MLDEFDILWKKNLLQQWMEMFHKNLNGNNENMLIWISDREELRIILLTTHPQLMIRMKNTWKSLGAVFVFISFLVLHTGLYHPRPCQCHNPYKMTGNHDNCLTRNINHFYRYKIQLHYSRKKIKSRADSHGFFFILL